MSRSFPAITRPCGLIRPVSRLAWGLSVVLAASAACRGQAAAPAESAPPPKLRLGAVQSTTLIPPRPGRWWAMPATVINERSTPEEVTLVAVIGGYPEMEYAQSVRLEAGEKRHTEVMIRIPESARRGETIKVGIGLRQQVDGREVVLRSASGALVQDIPVALTPVPVVTALLPEPPPDRLQEWVWRGYAVDESYELAVASRVADRLPRGMVIFELRSLPSDPRSWNAIDNLIINEDRWLDDLAVISALRTWLAQGGRIWVALDRIDPRRLELLIGDLWHVEPIDRVGLNEFELTSATIPEYARRPRRVSRERPVDFVRIYQRGGEVTHHVNGWPAAVRVPVGEGEVWVTTLSATGWLREIDESTGRVRMQEYRLEPWAIPIIGPFFTRAESSEFEVMGTSEAAWYIGVPVPNRWLVLGVLVGPLLVIGGCGWWLGRCGRLEQIGWIGPLALSAAAVPLLVAAWLRREEVPDAIGRLQLARLEPASGNALIREWSTIHLRETQPVTLQVQAGTLFRAFPDAATPPTARLDATDRNDLSLHVDQWPSGLHGLASRFRRSTPATEAIGEFSDRGLTVDLPELPPGSATDPVIAVAPSRVALLRSLDDDTFLLPSDAGRLEETSGSRAGGPGTPGDNRTPVGAVAVSAAALSASGEGFVGQTQRRRRSIYQRMIAEADFEKILGRPSVFCWSPAWESPLEADRPLRDRGEAINQLALRIREPEPGTAVTIPPVFLVPAAPAEYRTDPTVTQLVADRHHIPSVREKRWRIEWHLPQQLLPLEITEVEFAVDVDAPGRTVSFASVGGQSQRHRWGDHESPNGRIRHTVGPDRLVWDRWTGVLTVECAVGPAEAAREAAGVDEGAVPAWRMFRPRLTVHGTVGQRSVSQTASGN